MIKFACTCHKILSVTDDRAGSSMQCPFCGRLVDVPLLSDLANLTEDGTYKVGPDDDRQVHQLADMQRVFAKQRQDEYGRDIDLRQKHGDFDNLAEPETLPFADDQEGAANDDAELAPPKYDPVTGELVRPIDVQKIDHSHAGIPTAKAAIGYASPKHVQTAFHPARIIPELFKFTNLTVMLVIFCVHILLQLVTFPVLGGFFLLVPVFFLTFAMLMSHYAVIVEDIAVEDNDELPRPLRNFAWHEDLWGPFCQFFGSLLICYGGTIAINWAPPILALPIFASVVIFGTIAFPAVLLTAATSGTYINLSPDRLLKVISKLGFSYILCVLFWGVAAVSYVVGVVASMLAVLKLFVQPSAGYPWWLNVPMTLGYPLLLLGIFVMHGFCWYLALLYRAHHNDFGWAYQYHERKPPGKQGFPVQRGRAGPRAAAAPRSPGAPGSPGPHA